MRSVRKLARSMHPLHSTNLETPIQSTSEDPPQFPTVVLVVLSTKPRPSNPKMELHVVFFVSHKRLSRVRKKTRKDPDPPPVPL